MVKRVDFVEVDATNMPGVYRFDIPDTVVSSAGFVTLYFQGAADLVPTPLRVDCRAVSSNVKQVNDAALQGIGTSGDKWRAA
jgi:hypothetical protein